MNLDQHWGKALQFTTYDHARLAVDVRGIVAPSVLGKDFIMLLPWDETHPLAKMGQSVAVPVHIMVAVITGVWEIENYGKNTKANVTNPS